EGALVGVDARHRRTEPHLDAALPIEVGRPQQGLLERDRAAQVVLRERRTVVRRLRLLPDEQHTPREALLAPGGGGRGSGEAGADDGDRRHQNSTCRSLPWTRTG